MADYINVTSVQRTRKRIAAGDDERVIPAGGPSYLFAKRVFDFVVALISLIVLAPLFLLVAVAVTVWSSGPVFYEWKVVGKGGRPFTGYKFRTMVVNADRVKEKLQHLNEMSGPAFKIVNDPRVTQPGRYLRKYSIDELPQLWSVLKGDMSLVGPHPPLQSEYEKFDAWEKQKLLVKPGITCLWQVNGRHTVNNFDEWVKMDLEYIAARSFWLDIKVLALTIPAILRGTGV